MNAERLAPPSERHAARRMLVMNDEAALVELVSRYLEREGFVVETAGDGEPAVRAAQETAPDVVVLDLMLPKIDGLEVARQIRAFSDAYIVMLTAKADEVDRIVGLKVGADDYVTKPFSPNELVARIHAMLRRLRTAAEPEASVRRFGPPSSTPLPAR